MVFDTLCLKAGADLDVYALQVAEKNMQRPLCSAPPLVQALHAGQVQAPQLLQGRPAL